MDANAVIIAGFLKGFAPVNSFSPGVIVMTTDEIISALSEMSDISQADINNVIATLGFRPGYNDSGSFGWMMKPPCR